MSRIVPLPWRAVPERAQFIGADGMTYDVIANISPHLRAVRYAGTWKLPVTPLVVDPDAIVPVIIPDFGDVIVLLCRELGAVPISSEGF